MSHSPWYGVRQGGGESLKVKDRIVGLPSTPVPKSLFPIPLSGWAALRWYYNILHSFYLCTLNLFIFLTSFLGNCSYFRTF